MYFERITDARHPMYAAAMELYKESFPLHEQREALSQKNILRNPDYHFTLVYDGKQFIGLVLYWGTATFLYVEHFCILPELRNRHYGQRILAELGEQGKVIICRGPAGLRAPIRMLIALLAGSVANSPVLWYDKFNKLKFVLHKINYIT